MLRRRDVVYLLISDAATRRHWRRAELSLSLAVPGGIDHVSPGADTVAASAAVSRLFRQIWRDSEPVRYVIYTDVNRNPIRADVYLE